MIGYLFLKMESFMNPYMKIMSFRYWLTPSLKRIFLIINQGYKKNLTQDTEETTQFFCTTKTGLLT